jgi:CPA2 family monovalent cation:H+ antiporter-2
MPHDMALITRLAAGFSIALVLGLVADVKLAAQLSEIGVMLLMSGVGLHFSVKDLLAVKRIAVPGDSTVPVLLYR